MAGSGKCGFSGGREKLLPKTVKRQVLPAELVTYILFMKYMATKEYKL
jgi:hypothetical protein